MSNRTTFQDGEKVPTSRSLTYAILSVNPLQIPNRPAEMGRIAAVFPGSSWRRFLPGWANGIFKSSHPYSVTAT